MKNWVLSFVIFLNVQQASAVFCSGFWGREKSARPQNFSSDSRNAATILESVRQFRQNYKGDPEQPSSELIPLAENLLQITKDAKPFSISQNSRAALFDFFITEAQLKIQSQKVSLTWLLTFSYRLSFLFVDPYNVPDNAIREKFVASGDWMRHQTTLKAEYSLAPLLIKTFVEKDALALPMSGDLSLYAINQLTSEGVAPLFQKRKITYRDGREYFVDESWDRDAARVELIPYSNAFRNYAKKFLEAAARMKPQDRAKLEFYFYYLTHEEPHQNFGPHLTLRNLILLFTNEFRTDGTGPLLELAVDPDGFSPLLKSQGVNTNNRIEVREWLISGYNLLIDLHKSLINL